MLGDFLRALACDPSVSAQSGTEDLWFTVDEVVPSVGVYGPVISLSVLDLISF